MYCWYAQPAGGGGGGLAEERLAKKIMNQDRFNKDIHFVSIN